MQSISQRTWLLGLCGLSLLLIPLWHRLLAPVLRPPQFQPPAARQAVSPASGFIIDTLSFAQFQGERQEVFLTARQAVSENIEEQILLTGIDAELYGKEQKNFRIRSGEAEYDGRRDKVTLRRAVTIETDEFTGATEELHYYPEVKLAETSEKVELSRSGLHLTGTGLSYDMKTAELVVGGQGRVRCVLD